MSLVGKLFKTDSQKWCVLYSLWIVPLFERKNGRIYFSMFKWKTSIRLCDYPEKFVIYSPLDRRSETWFFTFLIVYVSWIKREKILISQFSHPRFRFFADQNGPKTGPHENEFWQFSKAKMNFQKEVRKADEKKEHLSGFNVSFLSYVLKLSKILFFLQFFADVSKNLRLL